MTRQYDPSRAELQKVCRRPNGFIDLFTVYAVICLASAYICRYFMEPIPGWELGWGTAAFGCLAIIVCAHRRRERLESSWRAAEPIEVTPERDPPRYRGKIQLIRLR
jgi:hypothetical protein